METGLIVADANVILRGLRSRNGASFTVLDRMLGGELRFALSPAVVLEYEDVLKRPGLLGPGSWITEREIDQLLDLLCARAVLVRPSFRFRPFLDDPKDDLYVECALTGGADVIVSSDRHFRHPTLAAFGLATRSPPEFMAREGRMALEAQEARTR